MSKRLLFTNLSGAVRITVPLLDRLPQEPESQWLQRTAFAVVQSDPGWDGWTYQGGVEFDDLPSRGTQRLPGAETYPLTIGGRTTTEERYLHFRECWRYVSGQVVNSPQALQTHYLEKVREERNRRLLESDGKVQMMQDMSAAPQRLVAYRTYRQQLRDLPASVTSGLAGRNFSGMLSYTPSWPSDPEA